MNAKLERRIMQMRLKETNRVPRLQAYHLRGKKMSPFSRNSLDSATLSVDHWGHFGNAEFGNEN